MSRRLTDDEISQALNRGPSFLLQPKDAMPQGAPPRLSDPVKETPMVVTLPQLRAYDKNPRTTKNPRAEEIKESIRRRGLDSPPQITRRPEEEFFIIRNGGNTRLWALNVLWEETHDPRFFEIHCLFRPWEGEVSTLIGHLAENEIRGDLTFIEKSVAIQSLKRMYEDRLKRDKPLSLRETADLLEADGLPVSFPLVGRMLACIEFLLPAIPNLLYSGLGRPQIEKLLVLRNSLLAVYQRHSAGDQQDKSDPWFGIMWETVLQPFDEGTQENFRRDLVREQCLGRIAERTGHSYNLVELDLKREEEGRSAPKSTPSILEPPVVDQQAAATSPAVLVRDPENLGDERAEAKAIPQNALTRAEGAVEEQNEPPEAEPSSEGRKDAITKLRRELAQDSVPFFVWAGKPDSLVPANEGLGFKFIKLNAALPKELTLIVTFGGLLRIVGASKDEKLGALLNIDFLSQCLLGAAGIHTGICPPKKPICEMLPDDLLLKYVAFLKKARLLVTLIHAES